MDLRSPPLLLATEGIQLLREKNHYHCIVSDKNSGRGLEQPPSHTIYINPEVSTSIDTHLSITIESSAATQLTLAVSPSIPTKLIIDLLLKPSTQLSLHTLFDCPSTHLECSLRTTLNSSAQLEHHLVGFTKNSCNFESETYLGERSVYRHTGVWIGSNSVLKFKSHVAHEAHSSQSNQQFLTLLSQTQAETRGLITVTSNGAGTTSHLHFKHLLLDDSSDIVCEPLLEINHSEVVCSHSAATLFLEPRSIHFMMARGLSEAAAKTLLLHGLMQPYLHAFPPVKAAQLWENISEQLQLNHEGLYGQR